MCEYSKNNKKSVAQQLTKPIPRSTAIRPQKPKLSLSISPPPTIFSKHNSYSLHTENYCMMFAGMYYKRGVEIGSNGYLYPTSTTEQLMLKEKKTKKYQTLIFN